MVNKRTGCFSACSLVKLSAGIILHLKTYSQELRSLVEGVHHLAVTEKRHSGSNRKVVSSHPAVPFPSLVIQCGKRQQLRENGI